MKHSAFCLAAFLLCLFSAHPGHAQNLEDFLSEDAEGTAPALKGGGGLGALAPRVPGGTSNIGKPMIASNINVIKNFAYGSNPDQTMDIYSQGRLSGAPVVFMVHGGGWRNGGKDMGKTVNNKVARWVPEGIVFISINYPMLPASVADQAKNVAFALATAQRHAAEWGADPAKFILMGHSAGAHLVSLVNADPDAAFRQGARPWLGTVSLDSGAMNIPEIMKARHYKFYDQAFGSDPAYWRQVSPYYALSPAAFPWMNVCSAKRDTSCSQSQAMADKAKTLGVRAVVHSEDKGHGAINDDLGAPGAYTEAVETFMASLDPAFASRLAHPVNAEPVKAENGRRRPLRALLEHGTKRTATGALNE